MSLISASALSKSFGAQDVFAGVQLAIPRQVRVALVGPNGVGKTTLLSILAGEETPDSGQVQRARGVRIGYLRQETITETAAGPTLWDHALEAFGDLRRREAELARLEADMAEPSKTVRALARYGPMQEAFELDGGYVYASRARQILSGLGFGAAARERRLDELSGGERTRAELARLLLEDPDLLLLDEPTNHLDLEAVEWLESWLRDWPGSALIVSHDRYFLDRTVEQVWELRAAGIDVYHGNYSAYAAQRAERNAHAQRHYEADQERIQREQEYIRRNIAGQNTRQAQGRRKRLDRHLRESAVDRPEEARRLKLSLPAGVRAGDRVLETFGLVIAHPGTGEPLVSVPDLLLGRGDCAAILGPNGAGKTSFLRTLLGERPPRSGDVRLGAKVKPGYFAQASDRLDASRRLLDEIQNLDPKMGTQAARDWLGRFHFTGDAVEKSVGSLSGGERGRLALACLALEGANLLLLDEPTNHLDLPSQEALQEALAAFPGTILLVSHDRYLVRALATQVWTIRPRQAALDVFLGGYEEMLAARRSQEPVSPKATRSARQGPSRAPKANREAQGSLERRIGDLEQALRDLELGLARAGSDLEQVTRLGKEYASVEAELDVLLTEWSTLSEAQEPPDQAEGAA
ncbi:MAG TPA: ABC-F family ATP-binding cassette domain-containing protein [Anaerolineales bacterium]|nr:ABC-F family ATP-binding cassette domain-containing protein [Anaerolineales bacterium]